MSDLSSKEKIILEKFLCMGSGYVLDFSNRTFEEFVRDNTGYEIYDEKYSIEGDSKGKRLRSFWKIESNYVVGILINAFIDYRRTNCLLNFDKIDQKEEMLITECIKVSERLLKDLPVKDITVLASINPKDEFKILTENIIDLISKNQPEVGLDRLHTYLMKYFREICQKYSIQIEKETTLNSLMGLYIKELERRALIESEMAKRILKSSISVLEAFNSVRNDKSFAHDNKILNYEESILIFNNIVNMVKYINTIEKKVVIKQKTAETYIDISF